MPKLKCTLAVAAVALAAAVLAPNSAGATEPVESPPAPPTGLQVDAAGDGITVSWQAAATGTAPTGYKVRVNPDCGRRKTKRVSAGTLSVTFGKVARCDTYKVWVKAKHSAGNSDRLETTWQRPQQQGSGSGPQGGEGDTPTGNAETGTGTVMGRFFQGFATLDFGIGCTRSGYTECFGPMALSGYGPLEITAIYVTSSPDLLTITLSGDWPDTAGWAIVNPLVTLNGSYTLSFDDANVTGRYAVWSGVEVSQARSSYAYIGPITKPAS